MWDIWQHLLAKALQENPVRQTRDRFAMQKPDCIDFDAVARTNQRYVLWLKGSCCKAQPPLSGTVPS